MNACAYVRALRHVTLRYALFCFVEMRYVAAQYALLHYAPLRYGTFRYVISTLIKTLMNPDQP